VAPAGARRLRNWLIGTARGELSEAPLQGLREAAASAYGLAEEAERLRAEAGPDPWEHERGVRKFALCAWNAFGLQTIGDRLLDSDAEADPLTAGLLPEPAYAFAQECYEHAMTWVRHAECARADADYRVGTPLPVGLPPWQQSETRDVHLSGLFAAYEALAPRAEFDVGRLQPLVTRERAGEVAEMNRVAAQMRASVGFARRLAVHAGSGEQRREVREHLLQALGCAYLLGELVVMPSLTRRLEVVRDPAAGAPLSSIHVGATVVDVNGAPVGTVTRVEGEPELGEVSALVVSVGLFSADRRVRVGDIDSVRAGVVRLARDAAELEPA
jgi:hypothetical protein